MQIKLNIEKKHFWVLTVFGILLLGLFSAVIAIAGGTNSPNDFGHDLVCATGKMEYTSNAEFYESSDGNDYPNSVFETLGPRTIGCASGWTMTSCSIHASTTEKGNDLLLGDNKCTGGNDLTLAIINIRCCKT